MSDGKLANIQLIHEIRNFYKKGNTHLHQPFNYSEDKYGQRIGQGDYFHDEMELPTMMCGEQKVVPTDEEGLFAYIFRDHEGNFTTTYWGIRRVRKTFPARHVPMLQGLGLGDSIFVHAGFEAYNPETNQGTWTIHDFIAHMKYTSLGAYSSH